MTELSTTAGHSDDGLDSKVVEQLTALVECESPSEDTAATSRCADLVDEIGLERTGIRAQRHFVDGRTHLSWQFGQPRVLLLGHLDTVWPMGTLADWPFRIDGDTATGPGVFDMKAGLVQLFAALDGFGDLDGVGILVTSDEEIGSPTSRALIEQTAAGVDAVLVLEPSSDGALKTSRKGIAGITLDVTGRAAHAGLEPERGINAAVELAHQILAIEATADPSRGTTVTPTVTTAGTTVNTVPAAARLTIDMRAGTIAEMQRVEAELRALRPRLEGAELSIDVTHSRPPLESSRSQRLFEHALRVAGQLGQQQLSGVGVGGGSDGNLTAALGVDTLDGLGAVGGNAHAPGEWMQLSAFEPRTLLVRELLGQLLAEPRTLRQISDSVSTADTGRSTTAREALR